MTPGEVLVPAAAAIVFVVAWFVVGLIDATRPGRPAPHAARPPATTDTAQAQADSSRRAEHAMPRS